MDPKNNQPINNQPTNTTLPAEQPVSQPVNPPTPETTTPTTPTMTTMESTVPNSTPNPTPASAVNPQTPPIQESPKNGNKKLVLLILILLILIAGMGFYVFFVKNQISNSQKSNNSSTVAIPTRTPITVTPILDELNIASPDADLILIEKDIQGL